MKQSQKKQKEKKVQNAQNDENIQGFGHSVFFGIVIVISLCLFSVVFFLVVQYSSVLEEQVESQSLVNADSALSALNERLTELTMQSAVWASEISADVSNGDTLTGAVSHVTGGSASALSHVLYCTTDGKFFYSDNKESFDDNAASSDLKKLQEAVSKGEAVYVGSVLSPNINQERLAVCVPTETDSGYSAFVMLYTPSVVLGLETSVEQSVFDTAKFVALCASDGEIIDEWYNPDKFFPSNINVLTSVRDFAQKDCSDTLTRYFAQSQTKVYSFSVSGVHYVATVAQSESTGDLCVFSVSLSSEVFQSGYNFLSMLMTVIILLLVIVVALAIYFVVTKVKIHRKVSELGMVDNRLSCLTLAGFTRETADSFEKYKGSSFALVSMGVRRFEYITEVGGVEGGVELLRKIRTIVNAFVRIGECYGYDSHGEFLMLLQSKQNDQLVQRLRELYRLVYNGFSNKRFSVKLFFGIYPVAVNDSSKIDRYVSNAKLAMNNGGLEKMNGNYTFYDESMRSSYLQVSDVEIRMDYGIRNREFRVFYQPKYNAQHDRIDGSEALVRWYDDKTDSYRQPESFLPLLEADGFISRLDHFVFLEVCRFIADRVAKGLPVVPISVNISRLTALDADFLEYYIDTKNHYKIPDKFITLELTESVAYENYGTLSTLMKTLRQNGFCCSIDDFGVGYSSYDLLKQLEVDEVKLDKIFIDGCLANNRAKIILENTVSLVNKLGIKVTQEGVEDESTFNYVKSIGCDVIQGYYYSKPIDEENFSEFIRTHLHIG